MRNFDHDQTDDGRSVLRISPQSFEANRLASLNEELCSLADDRLSAGVIVNLAEVEFIASSGIAVLAKFRQRVLGLGGTLRVCGLSELVNEVFAALKLNQLFDIAPDEESALD